MIPKTRILLIDDEPGILQTLRIILTAAGYGVETAWSSKEALGLVEKERFDLVVTDFTMPGMKGDELALLVKERWPGTPVVMLSGSAEILRASGRALPGVDVLMNKPFNMAEFRSEIVRLLAKNAVPANSAGTDSSSGKQCGEPAFADAVERR